MSNDTEYALMVLRDPEIDIHFRWALTAPRDDPAAIHIKTWTPDLADALCARSPDNVLYLPRSLHTEDRALRCLTAARGPNEAWSVARALAPDAFTPAVTTLAVRLGAYIGSIPATAMTREVVLNALTQAGGLSHVVRQRPDLVTDEVCAAAVRFSGAELPDVPAELRDGPLLTAAAADLSHHVRCAAERLWLEDDAKKGAKAKPAPATPAETPAGTATKPVKRARADKAQTPEASAAKFAELMEPKPKRAKRARV